MTVNSQVLKLQMRAIALSVYVQTSFVMFLLESLGFTYQMNFDNLIVYFFVFIEAYSKVHV